MARQGVSVADRNGVGRQIRRTLTGVALLDLLVVSAAILAAWELRLKVDLNVWAADALPEEALSATVGPWVAVAWIFVLATQGAYSSRHFSVGTEEFRAIVLGSLLALGAVGLACYLLKEDLSRGFLLLAFAIGVPALLAERYVVRKVVHRVRAKGRLTRRVVAVGGPHDIEELVTVLHRERYAGYEIVGACVPTGVTCDDMPPVPCLGSVSDTRRVCEELGADTVLVARGGYSSSSDLRQIAWDLGDSDIDLVVVPSLTDIAGPRIHMRPVAGLPLLHIEGPQADEAGGLDKRLFDVVGSVALLVLTAPLILLVSAAIWIEDRGPIIYRQLRIGRDGQAFDCFKLRSMYVGADELELDLRDGANHDGALFKLPRDPRVTRAGRFIRRYSLDELPQLLNVLRGEMSLVGPRPQQLWEVETYTEAARRRLLVRPGMTGLWQVSGRSSLSWDEAVRLDLYYVDNWSMLTDLAIMSKTVKAVLTSEGAY
jgi:exopolysaccharide biosynthesis polyprenyl glycosylphosphotransferase